jgi:type II secretory ATPase GspE/PulE/Tfp pilus assembly ATPase PilB-like protein/DNA-binding response OmpR family regulator
MSDPASGAHILTVDDDPDIRALVTRFLEADGMRVTSANGAAEAVSAIAAEIPDLVLMDVDMPGTDGFTLCAQLLSRPEYCSLPVVFLTARGSEQDKAHALAVGSIGYLVKPFNAQSLAASVEAYLATVARFCAILESEHAWSERLVPDEFVRFKTFLAETVSADERLTERIAELRPSDLYVNTGSIISVSELARAIARFLEVPRVAAIAPEAIDLGVLPSAFLRSNLVVPTTTPEGPVLVVSNPFNWQLLDTIERYSLHEGYRLEIAEPSVIIQLLSGAEEHGAPPPEPAETNRAHEFDDVSTGTRPPAATDALDEEAIESSPVTFIANNIIVSAVAQRASDIHIEPKETSTLVRFRIDGDMTDFLKLKRITGSMLISRFKVLGGLDIAEKRKPQDGSMEAVVADRRFKLRLATTSTPHGESLIVRLLEAEARPKRLAELGMTDEQEARMVEFANRAHGLICVVGPTGSGKTTTIYSLVSQIDADRRSIISIEDPVEYRIPKANQQQVNEKAGVTFESLLRSVVRQDPDVLFLGEIRDPFSAKMSMDFASTGHLTITSLHTSNATTALFRFERLGISRDVMAEAMLAIVAQRLIKRLCPQCKATGPITAEERSWLEPFTDRIPDEVARPVGCPSCNGTGYTGRKAVYEVFEFDPEVREMVRDGVSAPQIREFVRRRGDYLLYSHAIDGVRDLLFSPSEIQERILVEEAELYREVELDAAFTPLIAPAPDAGELVDPAATSQATSVPAVVPAPDAASGADKPTLPPLVLIVDDDSDATTLLKAVLERSGYATVSAPDGGTALLNLGQRAFDLVISDLRMPGLDGFTLLQLVSQQGLTAPVMILTASETPGDEARSFELGAADFMHKPIQEDVLLARIRRTIAAAERNT